MFSIRICVALIVAGLILQSCGIFGIHFKVKNPKKPGKYPEFTEETILLGELTPQRTCYDVHYYNIDLKVDAKEKQISGVVDIHGIATTSFESLQIDLDGELTISSITFGDEKQAVKYSRKERAVFVTLPNQIERGTDFYLTVTYSGSPHVAKKPPWAGGFVWKKDKNKNPWIGVACETAGASLWFPLKDHTADEPDSVTMHITCPEKLMAISNGRLREKKPASEQGWMTYTWHTSFPINTYNITLYIGDFELLHEQFNYKGRSLDLDHYVLSYNYEIAKRHFKQLHDQLEYFEDTFGEYPWYRDGYKLVESPYAGMEHQSAIAYGSGYKNGPHGFDYIILHESAHEWWGNSVSAADLADVWIHEGFASYAEALYVEHSQGVDAYLGYMFFQRILIKNKRPVVGPKGRRYFDYRDSDAYLKGSQTLHTLRNVIGNDSIFFDILKSFAIENKEKLVDSDDFVGFVNDKTEEDYTWFFNQYLHNRNAPIFEYTFSKDGYLYYRWEGVHEDFKMPLKLRSLEGTTELTPTAKIQRIKDPFLGERDFGNDSRRKYYGIRTNRKLVKLFSKQS